MAARANNRDDAQLYHLCRVETSHVQNLADLPAQNAPASQAAGSATVDVFVWRRSVIE